MSEFGTRLRKESLHWVESGLVSPAQRAALLARHPESAGPGRLLGILAAIGGALVLAGICLVISANWQKLNDGWKIAGVLVLMAAAYGAGWRMAYSPGRFPRLGDVFFGLGCGFFLAGIALVSQIYHLNARPAGYVFVGWLGIVAVPWIVRSRTAHVLSLATGLFWFCLETTTQGSWLALGDGLRSGRELWLLMALGVPVSFAIWLSGLGLRGTAFRGFASWHEHAGAMLACFSLYGLGFVRHDWRFESGLAACSFAPIAFVLVVFAAAAVFAWRRARKDTVSLLPWFALAGVPVAGVLAGLNLQDGGWLWSGLSWVSLFALNVAMVNIGLASGRAGWVNVALPWIALNLFTRYFDLFGTMMEGGVFFVVTGVLMLAVVFYLERKRRSLLLRLHSTRETS